MNATDMSDRTRCLLASLVAAAVLFTGGAGWCESGWTVLETKYVKIKYKSRDSLKEFIDNIDYGPGSGLFSSVDAQDLEGAARKRVDALFQRVQEILDMRKRIARPTIWVHPDEEDMARKFSSQSSRPMRIRAWYVYETNSVHINAEDIHEGILAHELAHAVIDNFLEVRPPSATAEILARYVDEHLDYDARTRQ